MGNRDDDATMMQRRWMDEESDSNSAFPRRWLGRAAAGGLDRLMKDGEGIREGSSWAAGNREIEGARGTNRCESGSAFSWSGAASRMLAGC